MSLAEQIAREHSRVTAAGVCLCGAEGIGFEVGYADHIAAVTERAVQERIATLIEAQRFGDDARHPSHVEFDDALTFAASIARGGTR